MSRLFLLASLLYLSFLGIAEGEQCATFAEVCDDPCGSGTCDGKGCVIYVNEAACSGSGDGR